jgi:hypothetical protein
MTGGSSQTTLTLEGGITCNPPQFTTATCLSGSGANLKVQINPASGASYTWTQGNELEWPLWSFTGTAASPVIITTNVVGGGLPSTIGLGGYNYGEYVSFNHVRMDHFGNSTTPAITDNAGYLPVSVYINDFVCNTCGSLTPGAMSSGGGGTFQINQAQWVNTVGCISLGPLNPAPIGSFITNSVFDGEANVSNCSGGGSPIQASPNLTIQNVVFLSGFGEIAPVATFKDVLQGFWNLVGPNGTSVQDADGTPSDTPSVSLVYAVYTYGSSLHFFAAPTSNAQTLTNFVFDGSGGPATVTDGGKAYHAGGASSYLATLQNSVLLPDWNGNAVTTLHDCTPGESLYPWAFSHNTGVPSNGMHVDEAGACVAGSITLYKANLFWNSSSGLHMFPEATAGYTNDYLASSTAGDYNNMYPLIATYVPCAGCTGQQNGYATKMDFSPNYVGAHDLSAPPFFADPSRRLATFDTKVLHTPTTHGAWTVGVSYSPGDVVSNAPGIYFGATVNYQCVLAHTATASNMPEGGQYTGTAGSVVSFSVISNVATIQLSENHQLQVGSIVVIDMSIAAVSTLTYYVTNIVNPTTFQINLTASNGTYTSSAVIWTWPAFWQWNAYSTLFNAVFFGQQFIDGSVPGCSTTACGAIEYLIRWTLQGWTVQNPTFLNYTYPGDPSGITNMGLQMPNQATLGMVAPVTQ